MTKMKRIFALLMTVCMLFGSVNTAAFAGETAPGAGESAPLAEHVLSVQEQLDALPQPEALSAMDIDAVSTAYADTQAAYSAYLALTGEEQAQVVGAEKFEALLNAFAAYVAPAAEWESITLSDPSGVYTLTFEACTSSDESWSSNHKIDKITYNSNSIVVKLNFDVTYSTVPSPRTLTMDLWFDKETDCTQPYSKTGASLPSTWVRGDYVLTREPMSHVNNAGGDCLCDVCGYNSMHADSDVNYECDRCKADLRQRVYLGSAAGASPNSIEYDGKSHTAVEFLQGFVGYQDAAGNWKGYLTEDQLSKLSFMMAPQSDLNNLILSATDAGQYRVGVYAPEGTEVDLGDGYYIVGSGFIFACNASITPKPVYLKARGRELEYTGDQYTVQELALHSYYYTDTEDGSGTPIADLTEDQIAQLHVNRFKNDDTNKDVTYAQDVGTYSIHLFTPDGGIDLGNYHLVEGGFYVEIKITPVQMVLEYIGGVGEFWYSEYRTPNSYKTQAEEAFIKTYADHYDFEFSADDLVFDHGDNSYTDLGDFTVTVSAKGGNYTSNSNRFSFEIVGIMENILKSLVYTGEAFRAEDFIDWAEVEAQAVNGHIPQFEVGFANGAETVTDAGGYEINICPDSNDEYSEYYKFDSTNTAVVEPQKISLEIVGTQADGEEYPYRLYGYKLSDLVSAFKVGPYTVTEEDLDIKCELIGNGNSDSYYLVTARLRDTWSPEDTENYTVSNKEAAKPFHIALGAEVFFDTNANLVYNAAPQQLGDLMWGSNAEKPYGEVYVDDELVYVDDELKSANVIITAKDAGEHTVRILIYEDASKENLLLYKSDTVTIAPKVLDEEDFIESKHVEYDGQAHDIHSFYDGYKLSAVYQADEGHVSVASTQTGKDAGEYTLELGLTGDRADNYVIADDLKNQTVRIHPRTVDLWEMIPRELGTLYTFNNREHTAQEVLADILSDYKLPESVKIFAPGYIKDEDDQTELLESVKDAGVYIIDFFPEIDFEDKNYKYLQGGIEVDEIADLITVEHTFTIAKGTVTYARVQSKQTEFEYDPERELELSDMVASIELVLNGDEKTTIPVDVENCQFDLDWSFFGILDSNVGVPVGEYDSVCFWPHRSDNYEFSGHSDEVFLPRIKVVPARLEGQVVATPKTSLVYDGYVHKLFYSEGLSVVDENGNALTHLPDGSTPVFKYTYQGSDDAAPSENVPAQKDAGSYSYTIRAELISDNYDMDIQPWEGVGTIQPMKVTLDSGTFSLRYLDSGNMEAISTAVEEYYTTDTIQVNRDFVIVHDDSRPYSAPGRYNVIVKPAEGSNYTFEQVTCDIKLVKYLTLYAQNLIYNGQERTAWDFIDIDDLKKQAVGEVPINLNVEFDETVSECKFPGWYLMWLRLDKDGYYVFENGEYELKDNPLIRKAIGTLQAETQEVVLRRGDTLQSAAFVKQVTIADANGFSEVLDASCYTLSFDPGSVFEGQSYNMTITPASGWDTVCSNWEKPEAITVTVQPKYYAKLAFDQYKNTLRYRKGIHPIDFVVMNAVTVTEDSWPGAEGYAPLADAEWVGGDPVTDGAGEYQLRLYMPDYRNNTNYMFDKSEPVTVTVTKGEPVVEFTLPAMKVGTTSVENTVIYQGTAYEPKDQVSLVRLNGMYLDSDEYTVTVKDNKQLLNAGEYTMVVTLTEKAVEAYGKYYNITTATCAEKTLTVAKKQATYGVLDTSVIQKPYKDTSYTAAAFLSGKLKLMKMDGVTVIEDIPDSVITEWSNGFEEKEVGEYRLTLRVTEEYTSKSGNYFVPKDAELTLDVEITPHQAQLAAAVKELEYRADIKPADFLEGSSVIFLDHKGDSITLSPSSAAFKLDRAIDGAGTYTLTVDVTDDVKQNYPKYQFVPANISVTVTKAPVNMTELILKNKISYKFDGVARTAKDLAAMTNFGLEGVSVQGDLVRDANGNTQDTIVHAGAYQLQVTLKLDEKAQRTYDLMDEEGNRLLVTDGQVTVNVPVTIEKNTVILMSVDDSASEFPYAHDRMLTLDEMVRSITLYMEDGAEVPVDMEQFVYGTNWWLSEFATGPVFSGDVMPDAGLYLVRIDVDTNSQDYEYASDIDTIYDIWISIVPADISEQLEIMIDDDTHTYSGQEQALLEGVRVVEEGTVREYILLPDGSEAQFAFSYLMDGELFWSSEIPARTHAGEYSVKISAALISESGNYAATVERVVTARIKPAEVEMDAQVQDLVYREDIRPEDFLTGLKWNIDGEWVTPEEGDYTLTLDPSLDGAGEYELVINAAEALVIADTNHEYVEKRVHVTVNKKMITNLIVNDHIVMPYKAAGYTREQLVKEALAEEYRDLLQVSEVELMGANGGGDLAVKPGGYILQFKAALKIDATGNYVLGDKNSNQVDSLTLSKDVTIQFAEPQLVAEYKDEKSVPYHTDPGQNKQDAIERTALYLEYDGAKIPVPEELTVNYSWDDVAFSLNIAVSCKDANSWNNGVARLDPGKMLYASLPFEVRPTALRVEANKDLYYNGSAQPLLKWIMATSREEKAAIVVEVTVQEGEPVSDTAKHNTWAAAAGETTWLEDRGLSKVSGLRGIYNVKVSLVNERDDVLESKQVQVEIKPFPVEVVLGEAQDVIYDGQPHGIKDFYPNAFVKPVGDRPMPPNSLSVTSDTATNAGEYGLNVGIQNNGQEDKNYALAEESKTANVTVKPAQVMLDVQGKVYGDNDPHAISIRTDGLNDTVLQEAQKGLENQQIQVQRAEGEDAGIYSVLGVTIGKYTLQPGGSLTVGNVSYILPEDAAFTIERKKVENIFANHTDSFYYTGKHLQPRDCIQPGNEDWELGFEDGSRVTVSADDMDLAFAYEYPNTAIVFDYEVTAELGEKLLKNYEADFRISYKVSIVPMPLTVKVTTQNVVYDTKQHTLDEFITSVELIDLNGDTVSTMTADEYYLQIGSMPEPDMRSADTFDLYVYLKTDEGGYPVGLSPNYTVEEMDAIEEAAILPVDAVVWPEEGAVKLYGQDDPRIAVSYTVDTENAAVKEEFIAMSSRLHAEYDGYDAAVGEYEYITLLYEENGEDYVAAETGMTCLVGNFNITFQPRDRFEVKPLPVTVKGAADTTITWGEAIPDMIYTLNWDKTDTTLWDDEIIDELGMSVEAECEEDADAGEYAILLRLGEGTLLYSSETVAHGNYTVAYENDYRLKIQPAKAALEIVLKDQMPVYDGEAHRGDDFVEHVQMTLGEDEIELTAGVDYELVFTDGNESQVDAGAYEIRVRLLPESKYYGNVVIEKDTAQVSIEKAKAVIDTESMKTVFVYSGKLQTAEGAKLNHSECALTYTNNTFTTVEEGNGKVVAITAKETKNYLAAEASVTLTVKQANMASDTVTVSSISDQTYTGKEIKPEVEVKIGDVVLKNNVDYALIYRNNVEVGEATVLIIGKGNLTGERAVVFLIKAAPTPTPTVKPTATPTAKPEATATAQPEATPTPTVKPTATPTAKPEATPTAKPEATPTAQPEATPTAKPTATPTPTVKPTATPTAKPTATPTAKPEATPTAKPEATPTAKPEATPTAQPEATPTAKPEATPTAKPDIVPQVTTIPAYERLALLLGSKDTGTPPTIVFDRNYAPQTYELLSIMTESNAQEKILLVCAQPDEDGKAAQRSLILSREQLEHLASRQGVAYILFENGSGMVIAKVEDMLAAAGQVENAPDKYDVEICIAPAEEESGYEYHVYLRVNEESEEITDLIENLYVCMLADDLADAYGDKVIESYTLIRKTEGAEETVNDVQQLLIPDEMPGDDTAERYSVTVSGTDSDRFMTMYSMAAKLNAYRHHVLAAPHAGEGVYAIKAK